MRKVFFFLGIVEYMADITFHFLSPSLSLLFLLVENPISASFTSRKVQNDDTWELRIKI